MPLEAAAWLEVWFAKVEPGLPWPTQLTQSKSVFLPKTATYADAQANYSILSVMSLIYRKWAAARLQDAQPWVESWSTSDLYGGLEPKPQDMPPGSLPP